jgi:hypothetical protein
VVILVGAVSRVIAAMLYLIAAAPLPTRTPVRTVTHIPSGELIVSTIDRDGSELPGATVSVSYSSPAGDRAFPCQAGGHGIATIRGLPSGVVQVVIALNGFQEQHLKDVELTATGTTTLKVRLQLAPVTGDDNMLNSNVPQPVVTPTPIPADMALVRCDPR